MAKMIRPPQEPRIAFGHPGYDFPVLLWVAVLEALASSGNANRGGEITTISSQPRDGSNMALHVVGASYGVRKLVSIIIHYFSSEELNIECIESRSQKIITRFAWYLGYEVDPDIPNTIH